MKAKRAFWGMVAGVVGVAAALVTCQGCVALMEADGGSVLSGLALLVLGVICAKELARMMKRGK